MRRLAVVLPVALLAAACAQVEKAAVFTPDFERAQSELDPDPAVVTAGGPRPVASGGVETPPSVPGRPLRLSLEQATLLAIDNNRDLAVRRLGPVRAGSFALIERGVFDPEVFASLEYLDESTEESSRDTSEKFTVDGNEAAMEAGVRQRLPSGTTVEARVEQERRASNRSPEQQTARVGLTVTQALLRGLGSAVTLARVRQAELDAEASLHELRGFTEALLADVRRAYWLHALAAREIEIFEESLAVARRQLEEVELRIEVGVLPDAEAPAAQVEVSRREQALIEAGAQLEERRLLLLRLLDPDEQGDLGTALVLTSDLDTETAPVTDLEERLELALRSRPDLAEARVRLQNARLETIITADGLRPRLELFAALDRAGFDDTFDGSFRELSVHGGEITVGLSLSHVLGDRAADGRDLAARTARMRGRLAVKNLEQQVKLDVRLAVNELERARQQIAASRRTRELQARLLEAEQERFDVGVSTGLLVAQAQRDLLAVQIAEVESIVAYRIALLRLWLSEGTLLERSGIEIQ